MTEYKEWICTKCCSVPCYCMMESGQIPTTCIQGLEYDNSADWKPIYNETKKQNSKMVDTSILHQPRQDNTGGIMKLWNTHPHSMPGRCIEATDLLHFCADSIADWECDLKDCNHECPWWFENTVYHPNGEITQNSMCLLDAIKSNAYEMLDPDSPDENHD